MSGLFLNIFHVLENKLVLVFRCLGVSVLWTLEKA